MKDVREKEVGLCASPKVVTGSYARSYFSSGRALRSLLQLPPHLASMSTSTRSKYAFEDLKIVSLSTCARDAGWAFCPSRPMTDDASAVLESSSNCMVPRNTDTE